MIRAAGRGIAKSPWTFHAVEYGNKGVFGNAGGEMGVYDVDGVGPADVVNGSAHNCGNQMVRAEEGRRRHAHLRAARNRAGFLDHERG